VGAQTGFIGEKKKRNMAKIATLTETKKEKKKHGTEPPHKAPTKPPRGRVAGKEKGEE